MNGFPSFASFIAEHGRTYARGTQEYESRRALYEGRVAEVRRHNGRPDRRWSATVNHLSDRTASELAQLRGYRAVKSTGSGASAVGVVGLHGKTPQKGQFLHQISNTVLPTEKSWAHLKAMQADTNQDACGSCWAVSTATMLRANAEIHGHNRTFSAQELVDCAPNPHHCGGSGGCDGATVEIGMGWVMENGLASLAETPYEGYTGRCKKVLQRTLLLASHSGDDRRVNDADIFGDGFHTGRSANSIGHSLGIRGWEKLPENEYEPLLRAVAQTGPVAVSVAADGWNGYGAGIFDHCQRDAEVDHAVVLIGYGASRHRNEKYWIIKNSWGLSWGENGNIRLLRHDSSQAYCGTDWQPEVGTGCEGGPSSVPVCGMCGILYDSVVAHFHKST